MELLGGRLLDGCWTWVAIWGPSWLAQMDGWNVVGYEPNPLLVEVARNRGLDVRQAWDLEESGLQIQRFQAITAIDVFYYSWHPYRDLTAFFQALCPGGVLAMRISNKRLVLGIVRRVLAGGERRDRKLSNLLQGQFHSIALNRLCRVLEGIGYVDVRTCPGAATARFWKMGWRSRAAYLASDLIYFTSLGTMNLSPGVLLFARKPAHPLTP